MNIYVKNVFLFIESFLFIYRKFLYMTMDIYSIYMRNDDPHGKVLYMQKLQFYINKKRKKEQKEQEKKKGIE